MAKALQFTCPTCGWSVTTPFGEEDLTKHVMMHKEARHPDMKMTEEKFRSMVKEVDIMAASPKGEITPKEQTEAWRTQENIGKHFRSDKKE